MDDTIILQEVANYLNMQPQTIYTRAQSGKILAAKIGKRVAFAVPLGMKSLMRLLMRNFATV